MQVGRVEYPERRSLAQVVFGVLSGCKEKEPLDRHELTAYALPE